MAIITTRDLAEGLPLNSTVNRAHIKAHWITKPDCQLPMAEEMTRADTVHMVHHSRHWIPKHPQSMGPSLMIIPTMDITAAPREVQREQVVNQPQ